MTDPGISAARRSAGDPRRDSDARIRWDPASPVTTSIATSDGDCRTRHGRFVGGAADGVEVVEIDTGAAKATVLPGRGMSLWRIDAGGTRFGWESPIRGPIHPARVPIDDPSGLGWLEGFDELLVRCGLESNGAPEFDESGRVRYPLHGRVANLAADRLRIECDGGTGSVDLIGEVRETRLFFKRLRMRTRVRFHAGRPEVEIRDEVTNELSTPATIQMLYHINIGRPLLDDGSVVEAPIAELVPKDELSASEIDRWDRVGPPQSGFAERVYFTELVSDAGQQTTAMIRSPGGDRGLAVSVDTSTLPRFIVWKNTAAESDGYVVGLEPATNFPNGRSFEAEQGRVVTLQPGETIRFSLTLHPLADADSVRAMSDAIRALGEGTSPRIGPTPRPGWSVP